MPPGWRCGDGGRDYAIGPFGGYLREAAARTQDAKALRRTLAIALVLDGWSRESAASACAMERQTLRDWVHPLQ